MRKVMKRNIILLLVSLGVILPSYAQLPKNMTLTRNVLTTVSENEHIAPGLFQVELKKTPEFVQGKDAYWFSYLYITSNVFSGKGNVVVTGNSLLGQRNMIVRPYRIGPSEDKSIYVLKNMDKMADDIGYGMEHVRAYGIPNLICDSVYKLTDDGYIISSQGRCYYCAYKTVYDNIAKKERIVWPVRKTFINADTIKSEEKRASLSRLSPGHPFFESSEGHYYYLYRDEFMPYTVLVIDNDVVELFDVYDVYNFKLKYSYNGSHWMAVGKECYWVDGTIKSVEGYRITDFVITNDGHYGYKAVRIGEESKGEVVVIDGQVIRRNANVCYFDLNGEGKLKFRFLSGSRYLQYENEKVTDVTDMLSSVCYPGDGKTHDKITILSNDGSHKLVYRRDTPSVTIDDIEVAQSIPCYAIFDTRYNAFLWNAVETDGGKSELVIYKCVIEKNLFQNMFR